MLIRCYLFDDFENNSEFVREQHQNIWDFDRLIVPTEAIYPVTDLELAKRLQLTDRSN